MQKRLAGVLFDLLQAAEKVELDLPLPQDPRARALAVLVTQSQAIAKHRRAGTRARAGVAVAIPHRVGKASRYHAQSARTRSASAFDATITRRQRDWPDGCNAES
jgi:hypothetical protein